MSTKHTVLAIQYGGHDTSAALMINGKLVAACEQERYSLDKHSRLFPKDAIRDCLAIGKISIDQVDEIAMTSSPLHWVRETYLRSALEDDKRIDFMLNDIERIKSTLKLADLYKAETGFSGTVTPYLHHICHLASSYYPSGFEDALLVSYDGMGEIETGMIATGRQGKIDVAHTANRYPNSLGLIYSAITFYLGWQHHCDEGIIMGLAPYGDAKAVIPKSTKTYMDIFREIIQEKKEDIYGYTINREWIAYYEVRNKWISDKFISVFGAKRDPKSDITQHHMNIAAALQQRLEEIVIAQLTHARKEFGLSKLCLAGGVALNCSMNGSIVKAGIFDEVFVQPASGDAGTAIGACYLSHLAHTGSLRPLKDHNYYLGARFSESEIEVALKESGVAYTKPNNLSEVVADKLIEGKIVGWFGGAAEFGPRALGNRSLLARPFPAEMKDHINKRVKFREYFRPFAPAVLAEHASDYFQMSQESPHMLMAIDVSPEKKEVIPAVVHVDGSCRVQTVKRENNPRFRALLEAFYERTGCPVLLNTSFNVKGQPIVNTPAQAIDCFKGTNIDCLAIGDFLVEKL